MSSHALLALLAASAVSLVKAQSPTSQALEPLASKHFTYPNIPYQVTGDQGGIRGPQFGYNQCNSSTENQQSLCQTMFLNDLSDFCMWSSSQTNDTIGESEAREVAWCTKPGHGTRVIPPGTITGAQFLYAKNYLQVVGYLNQANVGLNSQDQGGELDPHGADEQGNPLGGIVFTNGFAADAAAFQPNQQESTQYTQVIEWIDFIGAGIFCLKMCNPANPDAPQLCQHIYDEVGCTYNALADYGSINGTYTVCDSDDMADPGVFTTNGQATTWHQPPGPITTIPYTPTVPASSNCRTFASTDLWAAALTDTNIPPAATALPFTSGSASNANPTASGDIQSSNGAGTSPSASRTGSGAASSQTGTSGALSVAVSFTGLPMIAALVGMTLTSLA